MKKDNLKRIIRELEDLLTELKSEVYSDTEAYVHPWYEKTGSHAHLPHIEDDDGYAD
ncbi:hypothetical protein [Prochlorococcus sp. MIT 1307]|uniref:hypothetical protein n=1 Tax=Prochlorococcus sp. MIT 1307 TaxID=3096219 RepID=UPI002A75FC69|nr:hypothetical protein [Prochlorococcus sp. MIT 1307]